MDTQERFTLTVVADGTIRITIGPGFTDADVAALVAAERAITRDAS